MRPISPVARSHSEPGAARSAAGEPRGPEVWTRVAPTYATTFARFTSLAIEPLLDQAGLTRGMKVFDLACGPGVAAAAALGRGATVCGADFSRGMVTLAHDAVPPGHFVQADAHQLPWRADGFDAVISNFGVHTFEKPLVAFGEVRRVLRPGGTFAFTVWDAVEHSEAERLLEQAVRMHGDGPPAAPKATEFADSARAGQVFTESGFTEFRTQPLDLRLRARDGHEIFEIFRTGTIRLAKYLADQSPEALVVIREAYRKSLAPWQDASGVRVPMRAVLHSAKRS
ncbi:MAG: class I SAM-dependent methyltransferase [Candidatus Eiseniibacteriota bacterium]